MSPWKMSSKTVSYTHLDVYKRQEYKYLKKDQILYTYLHLAADRPLTEALLKAGTTAVAYETITGKQGGLPCLIPMSEIAGRMAVQEGAKYLEKPFGGRGLLLSGVPGVEKANVVILGGGGVGTNACKIAVGMGANVTILDVSAPVSYTHLDVYKRQQDILYDIGLGGLMLPQ